MNQCLGFRYTTSWMANQMPWAEWTPAHKVPPAMPCEDNKTWLVLKTYCIPNTCLQNCITLLACSYADLACPMSVHMETLCMSCAGIHISRQPIYIRWDASCILSRPIASSICTHHPTTDAQLCPRLPSGGSIPAVTAHGIPNASALAAAHGSWLHRGRCLWSGSTNK